MTKFWLFRFRKKYTFVYALCYVILIIFLEGCLEQQNSVRGGRVRRKFTQDGQTISYVDVHGIETEKIQIFNNMEPKLYQIQEKGLVGKAFHDTPGIHCILLAIDQYPNSPLRYACEDMKMLRNYFKKHFASYQQPVKIKELYNTEATIANTLRLANKQLASCRQYSTTVFAFSGHGTKTGIKLYDGELPLAKLKYYFQNLRSRRVVWIIDSCSAGAFITPKFRGIHSPNIKTKLGYTALFPRPSSHSFLHCFLGKGKILLCSSGSSQTSKDGVFIRSLVCHLESFQHSTSFQQVLYRINQGISCHNRICRPENILLMNPFFKLYGDIQIAVIHCPKASSFSD